MGRRVSRGTVVAAVVAVTAVVGGAALASGAFDRKAEQQAFLNDAAGQLNVSPDKLQSALLKAFDDRVDAWVAAGRLTQDQGEALKGRAAEGGLPVGPGLGERGGGFRHFGHGPFGVRGGGDIVDTVATYVGETEDQLRTDLQAGKTLAQVAQAHGKTKDGLKGAIHDATKTQLDQAVKDGRLTQTQADGLLQRLDANLEQLVTSTPRMGRFGHHDGGFEPPPADGSGGAAVPAPPPSGTA